MTLCPTSLADGEGYRKDVVEKDFKYAAPSEVVGRAVEITKHAGFQYFNKLGMYVCVCVCVHCMCGYMQCVYVQRWQSGFTHVHRTVSS